MFIINKSVLPCSYVSPLKIKQPTRGAEVPGGRTTIDSIAKSSSESTSKESSAIFPKYQDVDQNNTLNSTFVPGTYNTTIEPNETSTINGTGLPTNNITATDISQSDETDGETINSWLESSVTTPNVTGSSNTTSNSTGAAVNNPLIPWYVSC